MDYRIVQICQFGRSAGPKTAICMKIWTLFHSNYQANRTRCKCLQHSYQRPISSATRLWVTKLMNVLRSLHVSAAKSINFTVHSYSPSFYGLLRYYISLTILTRAVIAENGCIRDCRFENAEEWEVIRLALWHYEAYSGCPWLDLEHEPSYETTINKSYKTALLMICQAFPTYDPAVTREYVFPQSIYTGHWQRTSKTALPMNNLIVTFSRRLCNLVS